jgi:hypothetical protein
MTVFLKLLLLILGMRYIPLGTFLLLLDSRFHFYSNLKTLKKQSPDWIILNYCCNQNGLSETNHKIMAFFLFSTAMAYILFRNNKKYSKFIMLYKLILRVTLGIIFIGIFLKNIVLYKKNSSVAFF